MTMTAVRPLRASDAATWLRLRQALWPGEPAAEHKGTIERFLAGLERSVAAVLVAENQAGDVIGFVELSIRAYAEGCETDRVAFMEGWYVEPDARRSGVGRALVAAAEAWARNQGCTEFASDTDLDNDMSAAAHKALGFDEVAQIRCFRRLLKA